MLEPKQLTNIGFDHIIQNLQPFSVFGDELRRRVKPYKKSEREKLISELENVRLLADAFGRDPASFSPLAKALMLLKDIRRSLARSRETTLTDIELFEVKRFLIVLESLAAACAELPVIKELNGIEVFPMTAALDIVDPDGMRAQTFRLPDDSSEELGRIRRERKQTDIALRTAEPGERDELSAKRTRLAALEENEELRLRGEMTRAFSAHSETLERLIESIARLDFALAKARLMPELHGTVPEITDGEERIVFTDMVNPAVGAALAEKGREFTPVSIELVPGSTVITGANMGGKSVAVKTLALNACLAAAGLPVFAREAKLPMLSDIHLLAEDMEDSRGGLSSFGGEMVRFDAILRSCGEEPGALVGDTEEPYYEVRTYVGMKNAVQSLISARAETGTIRVKDYSSSVQDDIARVCLDATRDYPMGAYAVEYISHSISRILGYDEVNLRISYRLTAEEMSAVRSASYTLWIAAVFCSDTRKDVKSIVSSSRAAAMPLTP